MKHLLGLMFGCWLAFMFWTWIGLSAVWAVIVIICSLIADTMIKLSKS